MTTAFGELPEETLAACDCEKSPATEVVVSSELLPVGELGAATSRTYQVTVMAEGLMHAGGWPSVYVDGEKKAELWDSRYLGSVFNDKARYIARFEVGTTHTIEVDRVVGGAEPYDVLDGRHGSQIAIYDRRAYCESNSQTVTSSKTYDAISITFTYVTQYHLNVVSRVYLKGENYHDASFGGCKGGGGMMRARSLSSPLTAREKRRVTANSC